MSLALVQETKTCTKCSKVKDLGEYTWDKKRNIPLMPCRECRKVNSKQHYHSNKEKSCQYHQDYRKGDPLFKQKAANRHLFKKYGITLEQKQAMLDAQNGICALCPTAFESLSKAHVDHSHATGKVRDLLCHNCNVAIGLLKEDTQRIENIRLYLAKHNNNFASVSKFAAYIKEREGVEVIETIEGYASYSISKTECYIRDIYVLPEYRKLGFASKIADRIVEVAKKQGCTLLTGSVCPLANGADTSLKVLIGYGMKLHSSQPNLIIFSKEI